MLSYVLLGTGAVLFALLIAFTAYRIPKPGERIKIKHVPFPDRGSSRNHIYKRDNGGFYTRLGPDLQAKVDIDNGKTFNTEQFPMERFDPDEEVLFIE